MYRIICYLDLWILMSVKGAATDVETSGVAAGSADQVDDVDDGTRGDGNHMILRPHVFPSCLAEVLIRLNGYRLANISSSENDAMTPMMSSLSTETLAAVTSNEDTVSLTRSF